MFNFSMCHNTGTKSVTAVSKSYAHNNKPHVKAMEATSQGSHVSMSTSRVELKCELGKYGYLRPFAASLPSVSLFWNPKSLPVLLHPIGQPRSPIGGRLGAEWYHSMHHHLIMIMSREILTSSDHNRIHRSTWRLPPQTRQMEFRLCS